jgi:two-component system NtrC family sensor kinase
MKFYDRLGTRLTILFASIFLLIMGLYSYYNITTLKSQLSKACTQNAYEISDVIKKSTRYGMLINSKEHVRQIINTIATEEGVINIKIFNKVGLVSYSSDSTEINSSVDLEHYACNSCHSIEPTPHSLPVEKLIIKSDGVITLINPIMNEKSCYEADCHAHKEKDKLLGIISLQVRTDVMDNIISSTTNNTLLGLMFTFFCLIIASVMTIRFLLNKPLKKLFVGINEIASGNLDFKIEHQSSDELGLMALKFNEMSNKLSAAYNEIKDWNENLNAKIEQKNLELKNIYEQIVQVEKLASLGKLSATVAHELNNPLEGILTYSRLLIKKIEKMNEGEKFNEIIKILSLISDESSRCGRIVKDLLQFANKGDTIFVEANLCEIIDKAVMLMSHHFEINNIKIVKQYPKEPIIIECDPQRVEQALVAMLVNSVEAMNQGGEIKISLAREMNNASIRISDQGSGIPPEIIHQIFDPFFTTKNKVKDTGLGLSVVYGIVKQHNGRVFVEETSVKGTTFKVSLPIKQKYQNGKEE